MAAAGGIARGADWSTREQLVLASAVQRSGDQNWVSVSRAIRPVMEEPRQQQDFSQKNCATQYAAMLDSASTPKRKRREDGAPEVVETVEEQIVRNLTERRIKEIDQTMSQIKDEYMTLKKEIEQIEKGALDEKLHAMWLDIQTESLVSDTSKDPLSALRSSPSNLAKFQVPSRQEADAAGTEHSSLHSQQGKEKKDPKIEIKQEQSPPPPPPPSVSAPPSSLSSARGSSSSPGSATSSKEVHQEHSYSKQDMLAKKVTGEAAAVSGGQVSLSPSGENDTVSAQPRDGGDAAPHGDAASRGDAAPHGEIESKSRHSQREESELQATKLTSDETAGGAIAVMEDVTQRPKVGGGKDVSIQQDSSMVSQVSSAATIETSQAAAAAAVEEKYPKALEQIVKIEPEEEVVVDGESREVEVKDKQHDGGESMEEEGSVGQPSVEDERVSVVGEEGEDRKPEATKGEEEEDIDVDDEDESPVRVRVTRTGDGRKKRLEVNRSLLDRIKMEREEEREGSPCSLPSPRVRRRTRGSAKKKKTTRSARLRAEEREEAESREVTDQESEEELTSAFSSSVPSPVYSQGEHDTHHAHRSWRKTIMLVWHHASQHKYAALFLHPVREEDAPGYYEIIHKPMDLSTIKRNIETGNIKTDVEFQHAMLLMFQNALMYNSSDHDVYKMADEMKSDVVTQIDEYLKTQKMVTSSGTKALRSREGRLRPEGGGGGGGGDESFHKRLPTEEPIPAKKRKAKVED